MDVDGVVDEVLEIERTLQMDMDMEPMAQEGDSGVPEGGVLVMEAAEGQEDVQHDDGHGHVEEDTMETLVLATTVPEGLQSPDRDGQSSETGSSPEGGQDVTFVVQLNDEGAIILDRSGVVPTDAEPHVYFPITLPATKVKSAENPLVGAKHFPTTRSRKTKPQAILYNDEIDQIYEMLPDGSLNTITTSGGEHVTLTAPSDTVALSESMDVNDFALRFLPKDIELMERVLANAPEVLEIPTQSAKATTSREQKDSEEVHYDHSYCAYPLYEIDRTRYKGKSKITILPDLPRPSSTPGTAAAAHNSNTPRLPQTAADDMDLDMLRPVMRLDGTMGPNLWELPAQVVEEAGNSTVESLEGVDFVKIKMPPTAPGKVKRGTAAASPAEKKQPPTPATPEGLSQSEVNARSRRSQRQQDRIERQEAERILAENQQMLQREKELYSGKGPISPAPTPPATASSPVGFTLTLTSDTPVTPQGQGPLPSTPVTADITTTKQESEDTSARRPYPKRQNRKLPAHLADPNYVNLDETERKMHEDAAHRGGEEKGDDDGEDEKEINEDDPNKLWCICQKPHNNRFMICCDTCEEWFHGKCVGVTKAVGSKLDKWICPACKRKAKGVSAKETLQTPVAKISRKSKGGSAAGSSGGQRSSVDKGSSSSSRKLSLSLSTSDKEEHPTPEKLRQRRLTETSQTAASPTVDTPTASGKCIICKTKPTRVNSVFCSDECVVKHSQEMGGPPTPNSAANKLKRSNSKVADKEELENFLTFHVISPGVTKSTVVVPPKPKEVTASSLAAAKASLAKTPSVDTTSPGTITPSSSANGKPSLPQATPSDKVSPPPRRESESGSSEPKRTKLVEAARLLTKRGSRPSTSKSSTPSSSDGGARSTRKRLVSSSEKPPRSSAKEPERKKDPEQQRRESEAEVAAFRETSRSKLAEVFENRLKELSDSERADIPPSNTPEPIAATIEAELFTTFTTVNSKYRNKFRSILFNLKDSKNKLFKNICMNELQAKELVKFEPHQLASDELAQWRLNESKKELEMIKRSEIDKLVELKNQERIDAELGFEKLATTTGDDEVRSLGSAVISGGQGHGVKSGSSDEKDKDGLHFGHRATTRSSPRHKSHHHGSKQSNSDNQSKAGDEKSKRDESKREESSRRTRSSEKGHGGSKGRDKKGHESERKSDHRGSSDRDHRKSTSTTASSRHSNTKESPKTSDRSLRSREHGTRSSTSSRSRRHSESDKKESSSTREKLRPKKSSPEAPGSKSADSVSTTNVDGAKAGTDGTDGDSKTGRTLDSSTVDQELPSSTIKTPDFSAEDASCAPAGDSVEGQQPVLSSKFTMPELGSFNATLFNVSHFNLDGVFFPASPVPIVGRIAPSAVWDYIDKMKKTKEVIILRLAPATPADTEGYMTFFTYFSSRGRLGVLGGISSPLKDVYLVPLDKHSPVNKALLPLHGPGLPRKRAHCLLAVITRNFADTPAQVSRRKLSVANTSSPKRMKLSAEIKPGLISSLNLGGGREGRTRSGAAASASHNSATAAIKKSPEEKISPTEGASDVNDDDLPYTPWEEEDGNSPAVEGDPLATVQSSDKDPIIEAQIKDLEAKIMQEQAEIQNIELSLIASSKGSSVPLIIPGLDGEFDEGTAAAAPLQFLRALPVKVPSGSEPSSSEGLGSAPKPKGTGDEVKVTTEDDSAPYSPSQLDLEEET